MGDQLQRFPTQSSGQRKPFVLQTVEADDQCALLFFGFSTQLKRNLQLVSAVRNPETGWFWTADL